MKRKTMGGIKIADADQGVIHAVFATLNVKDHDGDVTIPGAFEQGAEVVVSSYNHTSWQGALPVGKGRIEANDNEAILKAQFFMDTQHGRDTFTTVKELGPLGEWSYGYDVLDQEPGQHKGEKANILKKLRVKEVSPVLIGAGINTQTVYAKSANNATGTMSWNGSTVSPQFNYIKNLEEYDDEELAKEAERVFKALKDRKLEIPEELASAVREADSILAETKRRRDTVQGIALLHGIQHEGEGA